MGANMRSFDCPRPRVCLAASSPKVHGIRNLGNAEHLEPWGETHANHVATSACFAAPCFKGKQFFQVLCLATRAFSLVHSEPLGPPRSCFFLPSRLITVGECHRNDCSILELMPLKLPWWMLMVQLDDCLKRRYVTKFHCPQQLWGPWTKSYIFVCRWVGYGSLVHWHLFRYSMKIMFGHFHGWLLFRIVKNTSGSSQLYILQEWTGVK